MAVKSWTVVKLEHPRDKKDLKKVAVVREAAILTGSYVSSDEVVIAGMSKVAVFLKVTKGSLASLEYKVQHSPDSGTTWYDDINTTESLGTVNVGLADHTRTLVTDENWCEIFDVCGDHLRVQVKGTTTLTNSSCTVTVMGLY